MAASNIRREGEEILCRVVVADQDDALLLRHREEEGSPWQTYRLSSIGYVLRPNQRPAPIYTRHGMYPLDIGFKQEGFAILEMEHVSDATEVARAVTAPEYFTLVCMRWSFAKEPRRWSLLQREMQFLRYKIERARRAKNAALVDELRTLYALLFERARPERELALRDIRNQSVH